MKPGLFQLEELWIDRDTKEEDELLLIKKINAYLSRVKESRERIVLLVCVQEVEKVK